MIVKLSSKEYNKKRIFAPFTELQYGKNNIYDLYGDKGYTTTAKIEEHIMLKLKALKKNNAQIGMARLRHDKELEEELLEHLKYVCGQLQALYDLITE